MQNDHKFTISVAPMMDWTDRHCRMFHRMLSKHALLYTEMVVADAVVHGDRQHLLGYDPREHPVALQIGGSDPDKIARAAKVGADFGYAEVNLNVGCPSDRVQSGRFGACLMAEPELVADCYSAMAGVVDIPVTVKCRIGIDDQVSDEALPRFLEVVSAAGCTHFIIHARKAWLKGLSPKENRTVPPLDYDLVREMKVKFPHLEIVLNGGIETLDDGAREGQGLDGLMYGRAAYHTPWMLTGIDKRFYGGEEFAMSRDEVAGDLIEYARSVEQTDRSAKAITRHIMGLYHGEPGARYWRRALSEGRTDMLPSQKIEAARAAMQAVRIAAA